MRYFAALLLFFASLTVHADEKTIIVTSISPITSIIENSINGGIETHTLTEGILDPHTFELTPSKINLLDKADIIVFHGLGLEFWAERLPASVKEKIIYLSAALPSQGGDMHTWLDPFLVATEVKYLGQKLCEKIPHRCAEISKRTTIYIDSLIQLHSDIKARIERWNSKTFVSLHPSWTRFAERYSLVQLGTVRSNDHQMLGTRSMIELLKLIKERGAKAVVVARGEEQPGIVISQAASLPMVVLNEYNRPDQSLVDLISNNVDSLEAVLK